MIRHFLKDETGAMTVEFVIWVPLLTAWFVISATAYSAFSARHAASTAAFALADVASRQITMDDALIDDLYTLQANLLPNTSENKTLRVSSIRWDATAERHSVLWSEPRGSLPPLNNGTIPVDRIPAMADGDTVLLIETAVPYVFISDWIGSETAVWRHVLPVRPRYVGTVIKTDEPSATGV